MLNINPNIFGISICDVNGNLFSIGDHKKSVAIESISKLFSLAAAVKKHGTKYVQCILLVFRDLELIA